MANQNYNFENCLINFTLVPQGVKLIDFFPELSAFPEFVNVKTDNDIKIAIALADIESPFLKIKENEVRLRALFEFLGIDTKSDLVQEYFNTILDYSNSSVYDAACRYIQMINHHDYAIWWTLNLSFYVLQKSSTKPQGKDETDKIFVDNKIKITSEMDRIGEKLKTYEARIFGNARLKQKAVEQELKKITFFPEKFAEVFPGFDVQ
jgi:hypothetical protein